MHKVASPGASLIVAEFIVPPPGVPGFGKGFDTHMMVWGNGRERTEAEVSRLGAPPSAPCPPGICRAPHRGSGRASCDEKRAYMTLTMSLRLAQYTSLLGSAKWDVVAVREGPGGALGVIEARAV